MSSEPPPNPITSTFNLSAWIQAVGSGLSLTQANTLYLSKKIADTAIGIITFTTGIVTNTITKYGTGTHKIFADDTMTITSNYGETNAVADFGPQARAVRLGAGATLNVDIGKNMTATSGNYIGIGAGTSQLTNIGIGTRAGTDIQSGTGKIIIGGAGNLVSILSDNNLFGTSSSNNYIYNIESPSTSQNVGLYTQLLTANISLGTSQSSGNILLGNTGGSGKININRPLTINYIPSNLSAFSQIGYTETTTVAFSQTFNSTTTAFSPNATQLPIGVYMISYWVYIQTATAGGELKSDLVGSTSAITAGNTTGFTSCGDGGFPPSKYVFFNRQPIPYSGELERNVSGTVYVTTNRYLAVGVTSTTTFTTGGVELQITRIA